MDNYLLRVSIANTETLVGRGAEVEIRQLDLDLPLEDFIARNVAPLVAQVLQNLKDTVHG